MVRAQSPLGPRSRTLCVLALAAVALCLLASAGCAPGARTSRTRLTLPPVASQEAKVGVGSSATSESAGIPARTSAQPIAPKAPSSTGATLPFSAERAMVHVRYLADTLGVRQAGSAAERKAADYVFEQLTAMGYGPRTEGFGLPNGKRSQNVIALKQGATEEVLVVGAHLDSKPPSPGANDDATGVGALLEIARELADRTGGPTVEFAFFGSEEIIGADVTQHHFGSRHRVASMTQEERDRVAGMISLDMLGVGNTLYTRSMKRAPQTLVAELLAFSTSRVPMRFKLDPAKTGMSDHEPYERAGIPALWIESLPDPDYHTADDVSSHVSVERLQRVGQMVSDFVASRSAEGLAALRR